MIGRSNKVQFILSLMDRRQGSMFVMVELLGLMALTVYPVVHLLVDADWLPMAIMVQVAACFMVCLVMMHRTMKQHGIQFHVPPWNLL